jgi:uncharacterized protein (DUF2141 family)
LWPREVVWEFDEFIQLKNQTSEMFVSPPLPGNQQPQVKVRGRSLFLEFPEDLNWDTNQTYVVHFGAAVVDLHEGNPADGLSWSFSTGETLDSLSIEGALQESWGGKPVSGVRVLAYASSESIDSITKGSAPLSQVAVSDKQGRFKVEHMPEGEYLLLAVQDNNRNYAWDAGEPAGLLPHGVMAGDSIRDFIYISETAKPEELPRLVGMESDSLGWLRAQWKGSPDAKWTLYSWAEGEIRASMEHNFRRDSLWAWPAKSMLHDTVVVRWQLGQDSGWDTLKVRNARRVNRGPLPDSKSAWPKKSFAEQSRRWEWDRPLGAIHREMWQVSRDSMPLENIEIKNDRGAVKWQGSEAPGEAWEVTVLPGGVEDVFGRTLTDTVRWSWETHPKEYAGALRIEVVGLKHPGWLVCEALADSVRVEADTAWVWQEMSPGKTSLHWTEDRNGDGLFNQANPLVWQPAEHMRVLKEGIEIRSNWDVEFRVDFSEFH